MMPSLKVLVPLDGSAAAERALDYLPILSRLGQLHIRIISVLPLAESGHVSDDRDELSVIGDVKSYLLRTELQLRKNVFELETKLCYGHPSATILVEASQFKPDFILMSSHGRSGLQRWRLGSVTEQTAGSARSNLLIVPPQLPGMVDVPSIGPVLLALDGSVRAEGGLEAARHVATMMGVQLHLAHVVTATTMMQEPKTGGLNSTLESASNYLKARIVEDHLENSVVAVLNGAPDEALLRYSEAQGIGLVVVTSHGGGSDSHSGLGRVAARLLQGHAPVLLIRTEGEATAAVHTQQRYVA